MAASQIKVLMDELTSILAEMGALEADAREVDEDADEDKVMREMADDESEEDKTEREMADDKKEDDSEKMSRQEDEEEEEEEMAKARSLNLLIKKAGKVQKKIAFYRSKEAKEKELRSILDRAAPALALKQEKADMANRVYATPRSHNSLRGFRGPNAPEQAYRAGMHIRGYIFGDAEARRWCADHGVEARAQAGGINVLGGVLTSDELSTTIIRLVEEFGAFPQYARRVQMNSDTLVIARRKSGLAARPVGENVEITDSNVEFDNVQLVAKIWGVANRIPNSLLEDSVIDLADAMAVEVAQAYSEAFDNSGFIGDGSGQYHGTVGAATAIIDGTHTAGVANAGTNNTTFDLLELRDFTKVVSKLPMYAKRSAAWYISPVGFGGAMARLALNPGSATTSTPGVQTINGGGSSTADVAAGYNALSFLGFPVRLVHSLEGNLTGTNSKVACLFGDLAQAATFGERRAISIQTARERYIELDQTLIHATTRNAMVVHDLGDNVKAGPLVALRFAA